EGFAIRMNLSEHCVVRRCKIKATYGIRGGLIPGMKNAYIADNVIDGMTPWTAEAMGAGGKNIGEGIEITGPGNVVCFNKVTGFRDCISFYEQTPTEQVCIDVYNNDVYTGADDGIEADFAHHNCRIMRNRLTNCFVGLSSQPGFGGPNYFLRNVMYNLTYAPFKLHRFSKGDVILHNTVVKVGDGMACFSGAEFDHAFFRNNLCIGGPDGGQKWGGYGGGDGAAACLIAHGPHCSFDYDALGSTKQPFRAQIGKVRAGSIEELRKSGVEAHAVLVDMSVFESAVQFPDPPLPERQPADLRPKPGSPVVDAALRLPNVNDGFLNQGPDIGAYEAGQALPHYGPRAEGVDEESAAVASASAKPNGKLSPATISAPAAAAPAVPAIDPAPHREALVSVLQSDKAKKSVKVMITFMGKQQNVTFNGADKNGPSVNALGNDFPLRWKDISDEDLARLSFAACGDDADALVHAATLATALKIQPLFEKIHERLLTVDAEKAKVFK
ncbi:MAG TPA: hypothetical protein VEJ63_23235, partial [Planctomycetota bacterium]|nr:hypothetical protein [Planctomycetota bacterium]